MIRLPNALGRALNRTLFNGAANDLDRTIANAETVVWEPADEEAMLALDSATPGDIAIRGDDRAFILKQAPYSNIENWIEFPAGGDGGGGGDPDEYAQTLVETQLTEAFVVTATPAAVGTLSIPAPTRDYVDRYRIDWRWTDKLIDATAPAGNTVACVTALSIDGDMILDSLCKGKELGANETIPTQSQGCSSYFYLDVTEGIDLDLYAFLTPTALDSGTWQIPIAVSGEDIVSSFRFSAIKIGSNPVV